MSAPPEHPATAYARRVVAGEIVSGRLQRLACERHLRDLKRQGKKGFAYRFDPAAADRFVAFAGMCRHIAGEWGLAGGQPFELEPWQRFVSAEVFGWVDSGGLRRFRVAYIQVARKNGKSFWAAVLALYLLIADGEPGCQVVCAATKFKQAKLLFDPAKTIALRSPLLRNRVTTFRDRLLVESTSSYFEPLGADSETEDGLNIHGAILDEIHAHPSSGMKDVIATATGARRQPLIIEITTAGFDKYGFGAQEREYFGRVVDPKAKVIDERAMVWICEPDKEDLDDYCPQKTPCGDLKTCPHKLPGWSREDVWIKANPNLGVSVSADDLRSKCNEAMQRPSSVVNFLTKHLNVWTGNRARWINLQHWDRCAGPRLSLEEFAGRECFGGLDLSSVTDMTAFSLWFPSAGEDPAAVLPFFFMPEERIPERVAEDKIPYDQWSKDGWVIPTPGDQIDHDFIEDWIKDLAGKVMLREVGFDRWDATQIAQHLTQDGLTMVPLAQTVATFHPACKELERLIGARGFRHGGHPVLRWNAENVEVEFRSDGGSTYMRPRKPSDEQGQKQRIDGMVATLLALSRSMVAAPGTPKSRYEEEGEEFVCFDI